MSTNKKSQMWFSDFAIGMFIFSFILVVFFVYANNLLKPDEVSFDDLVAQSQTMAASLVLAGTPIDWSNTSVESIGVTNGDHVINKSKLRSFSEIPYNQSRKLFGTVYDYFVFFEDENRTAVSVEGLCGIGNPVFNASYNTSVAYYYDASASTHLKNIVANAFNPDIYSAEVSFPDFDSLITNRNQYNVIIIEDAQLALATFTSYKDELENFTASGGKLILTGQVVTQNGEEMLGVSFSRKAGQAEIDRNASIKQNHVAFEIERPDIVTYESAQYIQNVSVSGNFIALQEFVDDNETAVAIWDYGEGSVLYISDAQGTHEAVNIPTYIKRAIPVWGEFACNTINTDTISLKSVVRIDRLLITNNKPVKMVVYVWQ